ncbi:MAG: hypothetical protein WBL02_03405 [Methanomethylovorans sp.]|uniref:hypothetical protein n=1 Tax=Methanomethylovorans sp. TaxID=2758717 RepID=UPI000B2754BD|nr:hypothetical protein [Methanomethylovorans sp.]
MSTKADLLKAIRNKCVSDCCCGSVKEISACTITDCALFKFRFGKDPTPSRRGFALKSSRSDGGFSQDNTELIVNREEVTV